MPSFPDMRGARRHSSVLGSVPLTLRLPQRTVRGGGGGAAGWP